MSLDGALDTGALIALERRDARMTRVFTTVVRGGGQVTVPLVVVSGWWRARSRADRKSTRLNSSHRL